MKKITRAVPYLFVLFFFFLISVNTPLTGDDWTWKSSRGIDRLMDFFKDYNGRYLSNIFEIVLVRNDLLRFVTLTLVSFGVIALINKIVFKLPNAYTFLITFILIMIMPTKIYAQTLGWTAGYVNYVISIFFVLLYIYYDKFLKSEKEKLLHIVMLFVLGFSTQLLVEHITLYAVFLAIFILLKDKISLGKFSASGVAYLLSTIIGAGVMFSNGAYLNILSKNDSYRQIGNQEGLLIKVADTFSNHMQKFLFVENYLLIVLLAVIALVVLWKNKNVLSFVTGFYIIGYLMFLGMKKDYIATHKLPDPMVALSAILTIVFVVALFIVIYFIVKKHKLNNAYEVVLFGLSAVILSLPFLILSPYGGRGALASYVFMVMVLLKIYDLQQFAKIERGLGKYLISALTVVLAVYYLIPITSNGIVSRERIEMIEQTDFKDKEKIVLPGIPYKQFHQMPDPAEKVYMTRFFKDVYGIPQNVVIEIEDE
ncbi:DUF6056 family protein [Bhargavaea beijingensis]|uniref:DUF6056 family protein n=1 Tax=Bhargavaea beijingensis TaxID=426756 RepID=UPI0022259314|nr:DUF6056 family protein [Bhargavaea beijingensis]MCW1928847.1 DUF6056 family protein [Bhargavaea beijingensis]